MAAESIVNVAAAAGIRAAANDSPLLLARADVARLLGMGARTFDRLVSTGQFPPAAVRLSSKLVRWSRRQVEDWIVEQSGVTASTKFVSQTD